MISGIKVLCFAGHFDRAEAHIVAGLALQGVTIAVICEADAPYQELFKAQNIPIHILTCKHRFDVKAMYRVQKICADFKPDIIHTFNSRALTVSLFATRKTSIKHITYRGTTGHISRLDPSSWFGILHPRVSGVVCVSEAVVTYLRSVGMPAEHLKRIYKGHAPSWYQAAARERLSQFSIPDTALVITCCASMRPVKGVDLLVRAFAGLKQTSNAHLLLIGEIRDSTITDLIQQNPYKDKIHCVGQRKDATGLVGACDIFVMPSRKREGLPKAVIEAMALGVPAIVSNVGGLPEIVRNEVDGLVFAEENVSQLTQCLERMLADKELRQKFSDSSKTRIAQDFSVETSIKETASFYWERGRPRSQ